MGSFHFCFLSLCSFWTAGSSFLHDFNYNFLVSNVQGLCSCVFFNDLHDVPAIVIIPVFSAITFMMMILSFPLLAIATKLQVLFYHHQVQCKHLINFGNESSNIRGRGKPVIEEVRDNICRLNYHYAINLFLN